MLNLGLDFNKSEYNSYTAITSCPPTKKERFPDKNEDKITTKSMREWKYVQKPLFLKNFLRYSVSRIHKNMTIATASYHFTLIVLGINSKINPVFDYQPILYNSS